MPRRAEDRTELDLGADARLFPVDPGSPAPLLSGEELAVYKVLAVFARAEALDYPRRGCNKSRVAAESLSTGNCCPQWFRCARVWLNQSPEMPISKIRIEPLVP